MSSIDEVFFGHHEADPRALLYYEWCQRRESGYAVEAFTEEVFDLTHTDRPLEGACWRLLDQVEAAPRVPEWPYLEWGDPEDSNTPGGQRDPFPAPVDFSRAELLDRIHGGWLGRCIGCALGKPLEHGFRWTPDGGDDLGYTILGLLLLEQCGADFTTDDIAALWLERLPFLHTYTAERVAYRNLIDGFVPPDTATHRNPYREWAGALTRADIYGYTCPGDPARAAALAARDASISHTGNGLWAAMWAAALIASAFTAPDPATALAAAHAVIPANSRLAVALSEVSLAHARGLSWERCLGAIHSAHVNYNRVHAIGNACLITAGLLWGEGDFTRTVRLTVQSGWNTNSNGATAGSVAGVLTRASLIPADWTEPLQDTLRSAVAGYDGSSISALARRTFHLASAGT